MEGYRLGVAVALFAALPLAAIAAEGRDAGRGANRERAAAPAKKSECVPNDSDKAIKANPCPPGYVPARGSKVPPLGSTDIGGAGPEDKAGGADEDAGGNPGSGR